MDFLVLIKFVFLSILLAVLIYLLSLALQGKTASNQSKKEEQSEFQANNHTEVQFMPRFFAYALCFLLFAAQCILLFPFAYISKGLDLFYTFEIMIFILILIFSLLFGIKSRLFELD